MARSRAAAGATDAAFDEAAAAKNWLCVAVDPSAGSRLPCGQRPVISSYWHCYTLMLARDHLNLKSSLDQRHSGDGSHGPCHEPCSSASDSDRRTERPGRADEHVLKLLWTFHCFQCTWFLSR